MRQFQSHKTTVGAILINKTNRNINKATELARAFQR